MFKTESVLGLIGSIIACIAALLTLIVSVIIGAVANAALAAASESGVDLTGVTSAGVGAGIGIVVIGLVLTIAAIVLGFMGTSKLKKDNKQGGVLLIIAGGLGVVSIFCGGYFGVVSMILFLIGGIMAVVKKPAVPQA